MIKDIIKTIFCGLCKSLSKPVETFKPTSTKTIDANTLSALLSQKFPEAQLFLSDYTNYKLCNYDDIARFLAEDETNKIGYISEERDCDDFAFRLMGQFSIPDWSDLTFGLVWTNTHALNIIVTEDMRVFFIEPQTDEILENLKNWMGTIIRFIII